MNLPLPQSLWYKILFLVEQGAVSIQNLDRSVQQLPVGIEAGGQPAGFSLQVNDSGKIRARNPVGISDGHPVFRE